MGNRLTEEEEEQTARHTFGEIFDELFPYYLLAGMTPEQYWDGESWLKPAYRKAFQMRTENEERIADRNNWYMGQYLIKALQAVPLLVGGLNVKRGTQLPDYPEKPFYEQIIEQKQEKVRKQREEDQTKLAMAMMQAAFNKFNRNFEKRQQNEQPVDTGQ